MSFIDNRNVHGSNFLESINHVSQEDVSRAIEASRVNEYQFISLLSKAAEVYLEAMAERAHELTVRYFGRTIGLYTPMYLSNYCQNRCVFCGFNTDVELKRKN